MTIKNIFSSENFTYGTLLAWAILLWIWIFVLLWGNSNTIDPLVIQDTEVYADSAICGAPCTTWVQWESCGTHWFWTCTDLWWWTLTCSCPDENDASGTCDDGIDNDEDGITDCNEAWCNNCAAVWSNCDENDLWNLCGSWTWTCEESLTQWICFPDDPQGPWCPWNTSATCNWPCTWEWFVICESNSTEVVCNDWIDNDWDNDIDCNDSDCASNNACSENICNDNQDNDNDSLIDCADPDCSWDSVCSNYNTSCTSSCGNWTQGNVCGTWSWTCEWADATCVSSGYCENYNWNPSGCGSAWIWCEYLNWSCITTECNAWSCPSPYCTQQLWWPTCDCGSTPPPTTEECGSANWMTYYTTVSTQPDGAGQWDLCTNWWTATNIQLNGNSWTWECDDAPTTCSATNNFCGDWTVDSWNETCEGSDLWGQTCTSQWYTSWSLSCSNTCSFNTTQCIADFYCDYDEDWEYPDAVNCSDSEISCNIACNSWSCCSLSVGTDCLDWTYAWQAWATIPPEAANVGQTVGQETDWQGNTCVDFLDNDCDWNTDWFDNDCSSTPYYCDYDLDWFTSQTSNCSDNAWGQNCADNPTYCPWGQCTCSSTPGTDCDDTDWSTTSCESYACDFDDDGRVPATDNCNDTLANCAAACSAWWCCTLSNPQVWDCLDCGYDPITGTDTCVWNEDSISPDEDENLASWNTCSDNIDNDCDMFTDTDPECSGPTGTVRPFLFIDNDWNNVTSTWDWSYSWATVSIYSASAQLLWTGVTNNTWEVTFSDIPVWMNYVTYELPSWYDFVTQNVWSNDFIDSDVTETSPIWTSDMFMVTDWGLILNIWAWISLQQTWTCDNPSPIVTLFPTNTTCGNDDGSLWVSFPWWAPIPTQYQLLDVNWDTIWSPVTANGNTHTFTDLAAADYGVRVTYTSTDWTAWCIADVPTATVEAWDCSATCDTNAFVSIPTVNNETVPWAGGSIAYQFNGSNMNWTDIIFIVRDNNDNEVQNSTATTYSWPAWDYTVTATYTSTANQPCVTPIPPANPASATIAPAPTWCTWVATNTTNTGEQSCNATDWVLWYTLDGISWATNIQFSLSWPNWYNSSNSNGSFTSLAPWTYSVEISYNVWSESCSTTSGWNTDTATISAAECLECDNNLSLIVTGVVNETQTWWNGQISVALQWWSVPSWFNYVAVSNNNNTYRSWVTSNSTHTFFNVVPWDYLISGQYSVSGTSGTVYCNVWINPPVEATIEAYQEPWCGNPSVVLQKTNESSCDANDGTISTIFWWSQTPTSYILELWWIEQQNNSSWNFSNLVPWTYTVNVWYTSWSASCEASWTTTIQEATCPWCDDSSTVQTTVSNESSCDLEDGSISAVFNWNWSNPQYTLVQWSTIFDSNSTGQFTNIAPWTYTVNVSYGWTWGASCQQTATNISVWEATCANCIDWAQLNTQHTNETACNAEDGTIRADLQWVTSTVTYSLIQWSQTLTSNSTGQFENLAPGEYLIRASYVWVGQICTELSSIVIINDAQCGTTCDNVSFNIFWNNELTCGWNDWDINIQPTGNTPIPQTYNLIQNWTVVGTSLLWTFDNIWPWTYQIDVVYSDCTETTDSIVITPASCTGWCDPNAEALALITNETICDANNGTVQGQFIGQWSLDQYVLLQNWIVEWSNTTGQFWMLAPGNYDLIIEYTAADWTLCDVDSAPIQVTEASCNPAWCGVAIDFSYSFANQIIQSEQCEDWVSWAVGRNLDYWERQCVWNSTITCQADIYDRDFDGVLDPDDLCIDEPGIEEEQWCPRTTTRRLTWWRWWSISPSVCGNGSRERDEQCDDGNRQDFDWCDASCNIERAPEPLPEEQNPITVNPTELIVQKLRTSIESIQDACVYDDVDYDSRLKRFKDISWEDRYDPSYILTLYCITKWYENNFQRQEATGIGEAVKIISKVHAIGSNMKFNERGNVFGNLPYTDMKWNAWYTPYVQYAHNRGILQNFTRSHINTRHLKAFTPVSPDQFDLLIQNAWGSIIPLAQPWIDANDLFDFLTFIEPVPSHNAANLNHVSRQQAAEMVVSAFPDRFTNYKYLVWNNLEFYQTLIRKIQGKTGEQQVAYVLQTIQTLEQSDRDRMWKQLEIDARVIIEFLYEIIGEL